MSLPQFVRRPDRQGESICTQCFLTVRVMEEFETLEEAQLAHACTRLDLKAMLSQSKGTGAAGGQRDNPDVGK